MESFIESENNIENSLFYFPKMLNFSDDEQELGLGLSQPYFEDINNNNIICGLSTNATTINENKNKNDKDEKNHFKADETYLNNQMKKNKNEKNKKSLLGRKREGDSWSGLHSKYSDDNIRRKCKHLVLDNDLKFLNEKIEEKYNGNIGHGIFAKKLLIINQKQKLDSSIQQNKDFLKKTLGNIFSENISTKYTIYNQCHNEQLINELTNEKDEVKKKYFKKLFSITFIDSLKHFRGTEKIEELEGMKGFNDIKSKYEDEPDYLKTLEYYIMNYEKILDNKRIRKSKKKEKEINEP